MEEHHALGGSLRTGLDSPPPKTRTPAAGLDGLYARFCVLASDF
jgi:hypothetical protein